VRTVVIGIGEGGHLVSTEVNKALFQRLIDEAWHKGDLAVVDELVASDFVSHDPAAPHVRNREEYKQRIIGERTSFPDFHITIDDEVAAGDKVVTRWTVRGTHSAPIIDQFGTIAPTGKQIAVTGITIDRWSNGQLVEEWLYGDMLGFMQQLGLMPQPDK